MKKCVLPAMLCMLIVGLTGSTTSAYYQYTTPDGTVNFVQSPDMVPPRYRAKVLGKEYTREPGDKTRKQFSNTTSAIRNTGSYKVPDNPETRGGYKAQSRPEIRVSGFRFNFVLLILLGVIGFFIAKRIEQLGSKKHAFNFRCISLFLLVMLAYCLNRDIVAGCTEAVKLKVDAVHKSIAEQREKDRKPLKTLSEKVNELMQQPAP